MNVLVIYAHPNPGSFNNALLQQVTRGLKDSNHDFTVIDLYKENFNPVLVYGGSITRRDLKNDMEASHYRELIGQADHLIFIYPIWWYGVPAILKGFFDRVLVSGFAFTYNGNLPKGLLTNKSAWAIYTIDSPRWFVSLFRRSAEWTVVRDAILKFCGIRKVRRIMFSGVKNSDVPKREKWLDYVYNQVRTKL